jgi:hypothetical protein
MESHRGRENLFGGFAKMVMPSKRGLKKWFQTQVALLARV